MADRPSILQIAQLGVEVTAGTPVGCSRKLRAARFSPSPQAEVDEMMASGSKFVTLTALNREWTECGIEGEPDYNEIIYFFGSVLCAGSVIARGTAGGGTTFQWEYNPDVDGLDTFKSYTLEYGDANHANRFANGMVTDFNLNVSRQNSEIGGNMIGTRFESVALGGTASYIVDVQRPILPSHWDIYLDDAFGDFGSTKLTRDFVANFSITGRHTPIWPINSSNASFAATTEGAPEAALTLQMGADAAGTALYNALRLGSSQFIRMQATGGTTGMGTVFYTCRLDLAAQVISAPSAQDVDDLYVWEWQFRIVNDSTWGKAISALVINQHGTYV